VRERALIVLEVLLAVGAYGGAVMILVQPDDLLPPEWRADTPFQSWVLPGCCPASPCWRPTAPCPPSPWSAPPVLGPWAALAQVADGGALVGWILIQLLVIGLLAPAFQLGYLTLGLVILFLDCLAFGPRTGPPDPDGFATAADPRPADWVPRSCSSAALIAWRLRVSLWGMIGPSTGRSSRKASPSRGGRGEAKAPGGSKVMTRRPPPTSSSTSALCAVGAATSPWGLGMTSSGGPAPRSYTPSPSCSQAGAATRRGRRVGQEPTRVPNNLSLNVTSDLAPPGVIDEPLVVVGTQA